MALPTTYHGYCTPDYFVECYDVRVIVDYLSDTGDPVIDLATNPFQLGDLDTNATLLRIFSQATQKLKMAVRQSDRYTIKQLDDLYRDADTADHVGRQDEIMRLVADIAWGLLISRRGLALEEVFKLAPMYKEALDTLEAIKTGQRIFDDLDGKAAMAGVTVKSVAPDPLICSWRDGARGLLGADCGCCTPGSYPAYGG